SGGMRQRVSLIRTLAIDPIVLLLDEPFSSLDFDIKLKVQREIIKYQKAKAATVLLVTHDIEDAIALSDKIIILSEKPTRVKREFDVQLGLEHHDPVEARMAASFRSYFSQIWGELRYLDEAAS
ncbi:MAG TPA: spermidine/putrescine ABC transporter ATP-binding protein, partial [Candidatus Obscuribacterales bacterium]